MRFLLVSLIGVLSAAIAKNTQAEDLVLRAPNVSSDGSYVLHLEKSKSLEFRYLELFRSVDGGEFELLLDLPLFKSLSQFVRKNGVYGYKVRGVTLEGVGKFSEPVFVSVESITGYYLEERKEEATDALSVTAR